MNVTVENFEEAYAESLKRLVAYLETQVTDSQKFSVKHEMRYVEKNKGYFRHCLNNGDGVYLCKNCGAMHARNYVAKYAEAMAKHETCFHCTFWIQKAESKDPHMIIVDGKIYYDGGNQPGANSNYTSLGFGGHVWKVKKGDRVWVTNNLWNGDTIPQEHRAALPDNAEFVKELK